MITPKLIAIPFASSGNKNVIYETRREGQAENEATWTTGFPPITMIRKEDGGMPPTGLDFNGIFYDLSLNVAYSCMGGQYRYNAEYAEKVGGYPKGAILLNDIENMQYISNVENNKINFNTADSEALTAWSVISMTDIDKLLAEKITNEDLSTALVKKANASTQINAGSGLTGGGTLATSRTISLATPSTLGETTTNTVTQASHEHELDKATTAQAGIIRLTNLISNAENLAVTPKALQLSVLEVQEKLGVYFDYDPSRLYKPFERIRFNNGDWYQVYNPDGVRGLDPRDPTNRPIGWANADPTKPYHWIKLPSSGERGKIGSIVTAMSHQRTENMIPFVGGTFTLKAGLVPWLYEAINGGFPSSASSDFKYGMREGDFIRLISNNNERSLLSQQADAMRSITGMVGARQAVAGYSSEGAFFDQHAGTAGAPGNGDGCYVARFDNARVTVVAAENRPVNTTLTVLITI